MTTLRLMLLLLLAHGAVLSVKSKAQSLTNSGDSFGTGSTATLAHADPTYAPPARATKLRSYVFDTFGPYPIANAAFSAGIDQADSTPPEWRQGAAGYGKRFGSDFGIAAVSTTTRYALAEAFKEDTLYYPCECKGAFPRLGHAVISTLTARRGAEGHRVFSFAALVAPYAGMTTAVYGWYPGRYDVRDAFRMGNYSLLGYAGGNIALEFLYGGPHSLLSRLHPNNGNRALNRGTHP